MCVGSSHSHSIPVGMVLSGEVLEGVVVTAGRDRGCAVLVGMLLSVARRSAQEEE